jgi:hypothetical protein
MLKFQIGSTCLDSCLRRKSLGQRDTVTFCIENSPIADVKQCMKPYPVRT